MGPSVKWKQVIQNCQESGAKFTDPDFLPGPSSIDGRTGSRLGDSKLHCHCKKVAKLKQVQKDGPNQGKMFYCCSMRKCNFFLWTKNAPHSAQALKLGWKRFGSQEYNIVSKTGFNPTDILQGSLGNCWFLAGLTLLTERKELIERIFRCEKNSHGIYEVRLFINGEWTNVIIDDFLPVSEDNNKLAFAKASAHRSIWVPLLEKAYAKAHGSYNAISGGFVSEAIFDLTGYPTEIISFNDRTFDSEVTWARLLSFNKSEFPMGCATSFDWSLKQVGLVGCHAYSILEVIELNDVSPGVQLCIDEMFSATRKRQKQSTKKECLRLLRVRNPWGRREWSGDWSDKSDLWTRKLHSTLGKTKKNDGTFWISFQDFLCRFAIVEICKAHKNWLSLSLRMTLNSCITKLDNVCQVELVILDTTWLYIMLLQKTKRGCSTSYWYTDINGIICHPSAGQCSIEKAWFGGKNKNNFQELVLPAGQYKLYLFTLSPKEECSYTLKVFSANAIMLREIQRERNTQEDFLKTLQNSTDGLNKVVHSLSDKAALLILHANNSAVLFIVLNASDDIMQMDIVIEAERTRIISPKGYNLPLIESKVPPHSQKIISIISPTRVGQFKFKYMWNFTATTNQNSLHDSVDSGIWSNTECKRVDISISSNGDPPSATGSGSGIADFNAHDYE